MWVCDRRGRGCGSLGYGFVISDCDRRGRGSLGCGFVTSDCDQHGFLGCGSLLSGIFQTWGFLTLEFEDSFYIFQGFLFFLFFVFFFFKWFQPFDVCFFVRNKNELWVFLILRNCLLGQCLLKVRVRRSF